LQAGQGQQTDGEKISQSSAAKSNSTWADGHAGALYSEFRFVFALAWDLLVKP
jgi:hypothetical protein